MGLFNSPKHLYNKFSKDMCDKNGFIHILDAPFNVSPGNHIKLNNQINNLISGMRSHKYEIIGVDPKFILDAASNEICNVIITYK